MPRFRTSQLFLLSALVLIPLRRVDLSDGTGKGYLNRLAERFVIDRDTGLPTIPAHHGSAAAAP